MIIYGALSDPLSYYENIGYDETMALPVYANDDSANNISINGFYKPIKINVNNKKVFINMIITMTGDNNGGVIDDRPLFEVINDSGDMPPFIVIEGYELLLGTCSRASY